MERNMKNENRYRFLWVVEFEGEKVWEAATDTRTSRKWARVDAREMKDKYGFKTRVRRYVPERM